MHSNKSVLTPLDALKHKPTICLSNSNLNNLKAEFDGTHCTQISPKVEDGQGVAEIKMENYDVDTMDLEYSAHPRLQQSSQGITPSRSSSSSMHFKQHRLRSYHNHNSSFHQSYDSCNSNRTNIKVEPRNNKDKSKCTHFLRTDVQPKFLKEVGVNNDLENETLKRKRHTVIKREVEQTFIPAKRFKPHEDHLNINTERSNQNIHWVNPVNRANLDNPSLLMSRRNVPKESTASASMMEDLGNRNSSQLHSSALSAQFVNNKKECNFSSDHMFNGYREPSDTLSSSCYIQDVLHNHPDTNQHFMQVPIKELASCYENDVLDLQAKLQIIKNVKLSFLQREHKIINGIKSLQKLLKAHGIQVPKMDTFHSYKEQHNHDLKVAIKDMLSYHPSVF